jgi:pyrroloquinoline quinone biosynthesis protein D
VVRSELRRPVLVPHARYRWDKLRRQHQIVFPEGMLVLNEPGAAILKLCDGRSTQELLAALGDQFPDGEVGEDVYAFLQRLARKGLLRDAAES